MIDKYWFLKSRYESHLDDDLVDDNNDDVDLEKFFGIKSPLDRYSYGVLIDIDSEVKHRYDVRNGIIKFLDSAINLLDMYINSMEYRDLYRSSLSNSKIYLKSMDDKFLDVLEKGIFDVDGIYGYHYYDFGDRLLIKGNYYNFILYSMLYAADRQKDNFENFKAVVDDIGRFNYLIRDFLTYEYDIESEEIKRNKNLIEHIVSNKNYKNNQRLREILIIILKDCMAVKEIDIETFLTTLNAFYEDVDGISNKNDTNVDMMLNEVLNKGQYSKLLLYGNRYEYLQSIFVEDNLNIKSSIFSMIKSLSYGLFDELNSNCNYDSFIRCMDIVFDSDSYYELFSKLNLLRDASKFYDSGQKEQALFLVKKINSLEHKEIFCGKVVSYSNCMNEVKKPKRIIDRMKELYSKIDSSTSYDFMDKLYSEAIGFESMEIEIFTQRKNPINKIKGRLKKLGFWKGH